MATFTEQSPRGQETQEVRQSSNFDCWLVKPRLWGAWALRNWDG